MNETRPKILIIGGGVAGLSAALALSRQDIDIHLVEKQDCLGGNAASWACMATHTCQNCGACLVPEMVSQVLSRDNIQIHLNTEVSTLDKNSRGYAASLSSGHHIEAAKIVCATGFTPFDPAALPSLHTQTLDRVITTARLNTLLKQEALSDLAGKAGRIAFLQCVGSRNRDLGRDYCSQVCCKISMRHAAKLAHLFPDARITLFYMDLQVVGKEARKSAAALDGTVELIQGVPAEILENQDTGDLTLVTEDPATSARVARKFDLVVLSVGMSPSPKVDAMAGLLGIQPNKWGFFNTDDAVTGRDIYLAGCAQGPKDILASKQEGETVAAHVLKDLGHKASVEPRAAVLGSGAHAAALARALAEHGCEVDFFGSAGSVGLAPGIHDLEKARILAIDGTAGQFEFFVDLDSRKQTLEYGAVIAAPEPMAMVPDIPGLMDLDNAENTEPANLPSSLALVLDFKGPEFKAQSTRALAIAVSARQAGKTVYVLMNKILVHGPKGQQVYDQARAAGIAFLRYNHPDDLDFEPLAQGCRIRVKEATLGGRDLELACDAVIVPPYFKPGPGFDALSGLLSTGLDAEGFLQPANIRHRLVTSPRKGVFFTGPGHDDLDDADLAAEVRAILADLATNSHRSRPSSQTMVRINEKKCAKCLTCYRICPHRAIIMNEKSRPEIISEACFSCHLCLSNCPAFAIESEQTDGSDAKAPVTEPGQTVIFACERSAALAAQSLDLPRAVRMVPIPCACRISPDYILNALVSGAERVVVAGCHEGNCRSMTGTATAAQTVAKVSGLPGMTPKRLAFYPVAANDSASMGRIIGTATLKEQGEGE